MLDKILLGLNGIGIAAAAGLVVYSHTSIKRIPTDEQMQVGSMVKESISLAQITPLTLPKQTVNLYSRQTRLRFLDTQMNIEVFQESDKETITKYKAFLYDSLIEVAGNMKPEELNSVTGRILLEKRIKNKFHEILGKKLIRKIYFSKFVIQ